MKLKDLKNGKETYIGNINDFSDEEILVHYIKKNEDGTITIEARINIYFEKDKKVICGVAEIKDLQFIEPFIFKSME